MSDDDDSAAQQQVVGWNKMFGSSTQLEFTAASAANLASSQLADVRFPEAGVASIFFQAEVAQDLGGGNVTALNLILVLGVGRTAVTRRLTWLAQPVVGTPLQAIIEQVPMQTCLATVSGTGTSMLLTCTLQVAPFTRLNWKADPLKFGMAEPGEADGFDDALRDDLEDEGPTVQQVMGQEAAEVAGLEDDDEGDDENPQAMVVQYIVDTLTRRLGRRPSRGEVVRSFRHMQRRAMRRGLRQRSE